MTSQPDSVSWRVGQKTVPMSDYLLCHQFLFKLSEYWVIQKPIWYTSEYTCFRRIYILVIV